MERERASYTTCSGFGVHTLPSVASFRQKLFFLGCGFAYNAARFWIYLGRRGISMGLVAVSFACLFIGQAFVLFGFWWL